MTKLTTSARGILALAAFSAFLNQAQAGIVLDPGNSELAPTAGDPFVYSYVIDNTAGFDVISSWTLDFNFTSAEADFSFDDVFIGGDVEVPLEKFDIIFDDFVEVFWVAGEAPSNPFGGTGISFVSLDPFGDVFPGETLGGFSFSTFIAPGEVAYTEFDFDGFEVGSGTVTGPVLAAPVPEPATVGSIALAAVAFLAFFRKRFSNSKDTA